MNKKFLSFLLALSMILGMAPITLAASADGATAVTEYYLKAGGTGDGRSAETPAASAYDVIGSINADHPDGGSVTVYVMMDEDYTAEIKAGDAVIANVPTLMKNTTALPAHAATIKYTTYGYTTGTPRAVLALGPITDKDPVNNNAHYANGDEIFENIILATVRWNADDDMYAQSHDLIFKNAKIYGVTANAETYRNWSGAIYALGRTNVANPGSTISLYGGAVHSGILAFSGWHVDSADKAGNVTGDMKYVLNNGAYGTVDIACSPAATVMTYNGNVNLVLNDATLSTFGNYGSSPKANVKVGGAIQIVLNNSTLTNNTAQAVKLNGTGDAIEYVIKNASTSFKLDTTSAAGTFSHTSTAPIYAYNGGNKIYSAQSGANLTVPAGEWNITTDLDTAKNAITTTHDGWAWSEADANGVYTYDGVKQTVTYYVMRGATATTGTGTADAPVDRTIASIINEIEANDLAKDGVIVIKNNPAYAGAYLDVNQRTHHYTFFTTPDAHTKTITIRGAATDGSDVIAAYELAGTGDLVPKGPMVFDNIRILRLRATDEGIMSGGHDMTLTATAQLYETDDTYHSGYWYFTSQNIKYAANTTHFLKFGSGRAASSGNGGVLSVSTNSALKVNTDMNSAASTYTNDATLKVDTNGNWLTINWVPWPVSGATTYNKNLNVLLGNVSGVTNTIRTASRNTIVVKGNLNVIAPVKFTLPDGFDVKGGTYILQTDTVATAGLLSLTDTAGKFAVANGTHVYAYGMQNGARTAYHSVDGFLTLPAGEWNVTTNVQTAKNYFVALASWNENTDGSISYTYDDAYTPGTFYVMKDGTGNGYLATSPMGSVASAIAAIEADISLTEGTIVIMSDPKYKEGGSEEGKWWPVYNTETGEGEKSPVPNYTAWDANTTTHTKTITVTGEDGVNTILATNTRANSGDLMIAGPTIFKNISLLRLRHWQEGIMSSGYDMTLDNVKLYSMNNDTIHSYGTPNAWWGFDRGHKIVPILEKDSHTTGDAFYFIKFGAGRSAKTGNGGTLTVKSGENTFIGADTIGTSVSYTDNAELNIDTDNHEVDINLAWKGDVEYQKNLNLVFGNVSKLTIDALNTVTVGGALQIIHPATLTWTAPEKLTVSSGKIYEIVTASANMLKTTATAGTYTVVGDAPVYAYDAAKKDKIYASVEGTLTVPNAGTWTVVASLEAAKAAFGDDVDFFVGDDGIYTVIKVVAGTYYVMYGGDDKAAGTSPNAPLASTSKAIELIEADSTVSEGKIIVMNNPAYAATGYWQHSSDTKAENKAIYYTAWTPKSHNKHITVCGFEDNSATRLSNTPTAFNFIGDFTMMGPTTFDNITLFRTRRHDEGFATCGYDVTFTDSVKFSQLSDDCYFGIPQNATEQDWSAARPNYIKFGSGRANSTGTGGTFTVKTNAAFEMRTDWKTYTYTDDAGINIDTNGNPLLIYWAGSTGNVTYQKNLNIVLGNIGTFTNQMNSNNNRATGSVTVKGNLQVIHPSNVTWTLPNDTAGTNKFTVEGDTYELIADAGLLNVTAETGKFKLLKPTVVRATKDGDSTSTVYQSNGGILDLTAGGAGKYTVTALPAEELVTLKFPAQYALDDIGALPNVAVTLPTLENETYREFKGWKIAGDENVYTTYTGTTAGTTVTFAEAVYGEYTDTRFVFLDATNGNDSNNGTSATTAVKSIAKAFQLLNAFDSAITTRKLIVIGTFKHQEKSGGMYLPGGSNATLGNANRITICGDGSGSSEYVFDGDVSLCGPITFENIKLTQGTSDGSKYIFSGNHGLVIGKGVTVTEYPISNTQTNPLRIALGKTHPGASYGKENAALYSGTFGEVALGVQFVATNQTLEVAGADVLIDGATVNKLNLTSGHYGGREGESIFTDDVKITVNSGSLGSVNVGSKQGTYTENIKFVLLNNVGTTSVANNVNEKFGAANVSAVSTQKAASDGTHLEMTDTFGTYNVVGGEKIAVATKADGTKIVSIRTSDSHTLTLGAGVYTVSYVDKMEYNYSFGPNFATNPDTLEIFNLPDGFTITDIEPVVHDGYYFVGWERIDSTVNDSNRYDTANLKFGDKFKAVYTAYNTAVSTGDFSILGVQIRLASGDKKQGLRYVVDLKDSFKTALNALNTSGEVKYGTLVLPTDLTHGHTMKINPVTEKGMPMYNEYEAALPIGDGSEYRNKYNSTELEYIPKGELTGWTSGTWSSIEDGPSVVKGEKVFGNANNGTQYTVCLTGINDANYGRHYSVIGYAIYTDKNGNKRAVYTDYYQTNLYLAAKAAQKDHPTNANINAIIDYYEGTRVTSFETAYNNTKADVSNTAGDTRVLSYKQAVQDAQSAELAEYITNKGLYTYGVNQNVGLIPENENNKQGILVNEVEFDFFGGDDTVFTIIEAGDTHLNSVNDRDWENQNPCILATYKGRLSGRNGSSVPTINSLMNFASHYDKLVIAGDILDYFSYGCAEMVKKLIVDRDKNAMLVMGNHEDAIHMQEITHSNHSGLMSTDAAWNTLVNEGIYESMEAIRYKSEILEKDGKKVMVIGIDNNDHVYLDTDKFVYDSLSADIAKARDEGFNILLFQHVPMNLTGYEESKYVQTYYRIGDTSSAITNANGKVTWDWGRGATGGATSTKGLKAVSEQGDNASEADKADAAVYNLITSSADVIKGIFCGDWHNFIYSEINATKGVDGEETLIPQYVASANQGGQLNCVKITIK